MPYDKSRKKKIYPLVRKKADADRLKTVYSSFPQHAVIVDPNFTPSSLNLTGWWRNDFTFVPWVGTPSLGVSGGRLLNTLSSAPSQGQPQNRKYPADFNNDALRSALEIPNFISSSDAGGGSSTIVVMFYARTASPDDPLPYQNPGIISTSAGGYVTIGFSDAGVRIAIYDGAYREITIAAQTNKWHVLQVKYNGTTLYARIGAGAWRTTSSGIPAVGNTYFLQVGTNYNSSAFFDGRIMEVMTSKTFISDSDLDKVVAYLSRRYEVLFFSLAALVFPENVNIVAVGDSITYGTGSTLPGGATSYPARLADLLGFVYNVDLQNRGIPSLSAQDLSDVDHMLVPDTQNVLIIMIGVNNLNQSDTAATIFAYLQSYINKRIASGWIILVCTTTSNSLFSAPKAAEMLAYNNLIRAAYTPIADIFADPTMGLAGNSSSGPPNWNIDGLHPYDGGYQIIASVIAGVTLPQGPAPTILTEFGPMKDASLTGWFRDRNLINAFETNAYELYNIVKTDIQDTYFLAASVPPTRVLANLNGHPIIRFPGNVDSYYLTPGGKNLSNFITASEFVLHVVVKPISITTNDNTVYYSNNAILCDSNAVFGLTMRTGGGTPKVIAGLNNSPIVKVETDITVGSWQIVSMRLLGGKLGIRVGASGAWIEAPETGVTLSATNGSLRLGNTTTLLHPGNFDFADLIIRNSYNSSMVDSDLAYLTARYSL